MPKVNDVTQADILNALIGFCYQYSAPALPDEMHVVDGFGNNRTLPKDGNDFCIVTPITMSRSGTNIERWEEDGQELLELQEYVNLDVQIDCYSTNGFDAMERAQTLETVARSEYGVNHFLESGIDCLYAEGIQNLSAVIDAKQYVSRWMLTLHLGYWKRVKLAQDFFNTAIVDVVNVDSKFKP